MIVPTILACLLAVPGFAAAGGPSVVHGQSHAEKPFLVNADVVLSSLIALSDGQLQKMADSFHILAVSEAVRSGDWERIRGPLGKAGKRNASALYWFALPDGSYWSVQHGKEKANLTTRVYFPRVLMGEPIIGQLVTSKATGKPVAIVAVPIVNLQGVVVGVLGASVYLDRLSAWVSREMGLHKRMIFFSFDKTPLIALDWDPGLIFFRPMESRAPELIEAFGRMLRTDNGMVHYRYRGEPRTVIYRRSPVTHWWYAFGIIRNSLGKSNPPPKTE